jgi:hypothetical protein
MPRTQMEDFRDPTLQPKRASSELISSSSAAQQLPPAISGQIHNPSIPPLFPPAPAPVPLPAPAQLSTWQL